MAFLGPYYEEYSDINTKWKKNKWAMIEKKKATLTEEMVNAINYYCQEEQDKEIRILSEKYNIIEVI